MTQNVGSSSQAAKGLQGGRVTVVHGFENQGLRKGWRGLFALTFLFVSAAASYAFIFVLIDKWYKGGSLGIF